MQDTASLDGPTGSVSPQANGARSTGPAQKAPRIIKWALIGVGAAGVLIGTAYFAYCPPDRQPAPRADLPEWFDPAHRISKNRGIIFPPKTATKAIGTQNPQYTEEWLEASFTHYIGSSNAFIWSTPRLRYPAEGKILAGIKVIVGEQVDDLSLICTLTADGRPENMYVPSALLRERSLGPPPASKDD